MPFLFDSFAPILTVGLIVVYSHVLYTDFTRFKITNATILSLLAIGCAAKFVIGSSTILPDLITAGLLFALTFVFWLARALGAGDVKLLTVSGFIIGSGNILEFAVYILAFSFLLLVAAAFSGFLLFLPTVVNQQLVAIIQKGKVPYGVPISLAAIAILSFRLAASV